MNFDWPELESGSPHEAFRQAALQYALLLYTIVRDDLVMAPRASDVIASAKTFEDYLRHMVTLEIGRAERLGGQMDYRNEISRYLNDVRDLVRELDSDEARDILYDLGKAEELLDGLEEYAYQSGWDNGYGFADSAT